MLLYSIQLRSSNKMCGELLPNKSVRRMNVPNKYARYTAANLSANWNIDKFNNEFKIFSAQLLRNFNVDQSCILTLKAVIH